jgi:hypothetical protein
LVVNSFEINIQKECFQMNQLPLIPDSNDIEQLSLPSIVAQHWNFPLAHVQTENGTVYAVQDWMRGLSGEEDVRRLWDMFKKSEAGKQMSNSIGRMPYKTANGRTQWANSSTRLCQRQGLVSDCPIHACEA